MTNDKDQNNSSVRSADAKEKEAFARRVYKLMLDKGLTQSDLARKAGLERNRISAYVRGNALPTGLSLKKLADALSIDPNDLLSDERLAPGKPAYSMMVSPDGTRANITADVWVPTAIGAQIISLLGEHATANRD
jgi:transcriptional regulator with XRE-family HTH domain